MGRIMPYTMEHQTCSKPPTRYIYIYIYIIDICMLSCIVIYMNYIELIWFYWYVICDLYIDLSTCKYTMMFTDASVQTVQVMANVCLRSFLPTMPMYSDQTSFLTIPTKSGCDDLLITNHFHNHKELYLCKFLYWGVVASSIPLIKNIPSISGIPLCMPIHTQSTPWKHLEIEPWKQASKR